MPLGLAAPATLYIGWSETSMAIVRVSLSPLLALHGLHGSMEAHTVGSLEAHVHLGGLCMRGWVDVHAHALLGQPSRSSRPGRAARSGLGERGRPLMHAP